VNLVHRDIKPSNIMVRLKDDGGITAKIIDLGLAKPITEPNLQTAISTPGGFVGTPEFASPEQFAGLALDTRSDLYSLGVTLWEMLTGRTPFRGAPSEVMYQHQHAPLPLDELEGVPQPPVILLEALLEKDPGQRFQSPGDLLKAIPTITGRIEAGRRITRLSLQRTPPAASRVGARKPRAKLAPKKISVARLPVTGSERCNGAFSYAEIERLADQGDKLIMRTKKAYRGESVSPEQKSQSYHAITVQFDPLNGQPHPAHRQPFFRLSALRSPFALVMPW
jgi:serine/threonine protein kinase